MEPHCIGEDSPPGIALSLSPAVDIEMESGKRTLGILVQVERASTVNASIEIMWRGTRTVVGYTPAYARGWEEVFGKEPARN
jgi:hypothetical protein